NRRYRLFHRRLDIFQQSSRRSRRAGATEDEVRTGSGSDRIRRNLRNPLELLDPVATARGSDTMRPQNSVAFEHGGRYKTPYWMDGWTERVGLIRSSTACLAGKGSLCVTKKLKFATAGANI